MCIVVGGRKADAQPCGAVGHCRRANGGHEKPVLLQACLGVEGVAFTANDDGDDGALGVGEPQRGGEPAGQLQGATAAVDVATCMRRSPLAATTCTANVTLSWHVHACCCRIEAGLTGICCCMLAVTVISVLVMVEV